MKTDVSEAFTLVLRRRTGLGGSLSGRAAVTVRMGYHPTSGFSCQREDGRPLTLAEAETADPTLVEAIKQRLLRSYATRKQIISSSALISAKPPEKDTPAPLPSDAPSTERLPDRLRLRAGESLVCEGIGNVAQHMAAMREQQRRRSSTVAALDLQEADDYLADDDLCVEVPVLTENPTTAPVTTQRIRLNQPELAAKIQEYRESTRISRRRRA